MGWLERMERGERFGLGFVEDRRLLASRGSERRGDQAPKAPRAFVAVSAVASCGNRGCESKEGGEGAEGSGQSKHTQLRRMDASREKDSAGRGIV